MEHIVKVILASLAFYHSVQYGYLVLVQKKVWMLSGTTLEGGKWLPPPVDLRVEDAFGGGISLSGRPKTAWVDPAEDEETPPNWLL